MMPCRSTPRIATLTARLRRLAFDLDNPVDLLDRAIVIVKRDLDIRVHELEQERRRISEAWELRSTEVNWDWRPAARFISDWLDANWRSPKNVWMTKHPGLPLTLHFEDRGDINKRWESKHEAKWKTMMKQLEKRFGMKEILRSGAPQFVLPDGKTKVQIEVLFFGGSPSSEML